MMEWLLIVAIGVGVVLYVRRDEHGPKRPDALTGKTKAGWSNLAPEEFVVLDFETTGLDATTHQIIEMGAILVRREQLLETRPNLKTFQALVRSKKKLPKKIVELTGIDDALLERDGEDLATALRGLLDFIGDRPLVAFNAKFDRGFLLAAAEEHGLTVRNRWICALEKARDTWPGRKSYKLSVLTETVDVAGSHRALADAQRALIVYAGCLRA